MIGSDVDSCLRELDVCEDQGVRMGLGGRYLALQHCHLLPSRHPQVLHSLRAEWEGMG